MNKLVKELIDIERKNPEKFENKKAAYAKLIGKDSVTDEEYGKFCLDSICSKTKTVLGIVAFAAGAGFLFGKSHERSIWHKYTGGPKEWYCKGADGKVVNGDLIDVLKEEAKMGKQMMYYASWDPKKVNGRTPVISIDWSREGDRKGDPIEK